MQWTDEGLVLGLRRQGETGVVLELMTAAHGRHLGLVHGGRSRRMQPMLQPGRQGWPGTMLDLNNAVPLTLQQMQALEWLSRERHRAWTGKGGGSPTRGTLDSLIRRGLAGRMASNADLYWITALGRMMSPFLAERRARDPLDDVRHA